MSLYLPEKYFARLSDVDLKKDITSQGYENILLDVDNTILTRDTSTVPIDVKRWIIKAKDKGIKICLISNDWHQNVIGVAKDLELPIVVKSLKPLPHAFFRALKKIGANKKNTIMIGDQLMTDVLGAHLVGLKCYLLCPLVKADLKHTLILRKFEKLILRGNVPQTN